MGREENFDGAGVVILLSVMLMVSTVSAVGFLATLIT